MSPDPDPCPTPTVLGQCVRGELVGDEADRVVAHFEGCAACQAAVEQVTRPAPPPLAAPPKIPGFTDLDDGKRIGAGGMGEVFQATETSIGREVAVKIIHRDHAGSGQRAQLVRRFEEECRLLGRIQHSGVPPVYQFGWVAADQPYLVMRLIPWPTLADELAVDWAPGKGGPTPDRLNQYLIWFSRVCEAVGYAHDHGAVHLDLKPANVKVHPSGEVQVLDWGLGRGFMATPDGRTRLFSESAVGVSSDPLGHTAGYSPPEQVKGGHPDPKMHPRADVFALGSVLCEVLTGSPAFVGATPLERYNQARNCDLTDARARLAVAARRHPLLVALVHRCLAPNPTDRPADAGVIATEVRRIILSAEDRLRTTRWRFRLGAAVAAAAVLVAAAAGAAAYWKVKGDAEVTQAKLDKKEIEDRTAAKEAEAAREARARVETAARDHLQRAVDAEKRTESPDFGHPDTRDALAAVWAEAGREVKAADDTISDRTVDPELRQSIRAARDGIKEKSEEFVADKALLDALDAIRAGKVSFPDTDDKVHFSGEYFYSRRGVNDFKEAFNTAELFPDPAADKQAKFVADIDKRKRVRARVVAALDQWYLLDRTPDRGWILDLADRIDDDPDRKLVRAAVRRGRGAVAKVFVQTPGLAARLMPEAAILAAAGLEEWSATGVRAAPPPSTGANMEPPTRGIDDAIAVLRPALARVSAVANDDRAATYWLHLTLGFYLWNAAGHLDRWATAEEAVAVFGKAEALVAPRGRIPAGERAAAGVLRAAAGGMRAHVEARRARPADVGRVLDQALQTYPGHWPTWQHAVLVRFDHGDDGGALQVVLDWQKQHPDSALARGYADFVRALSADKPRDAARKLAWWSEDPAIPTLARLQLAELWDATDTARGARGVRGMPAHPCRPGADLVLVLDARVRFDLACDPCRLPNPARSPAAALGFRPWRVGTDDRAGAGFGRTAGEEWTLPQHAADGYDRAGKAAPWAIGPQHGTVRAKLAAGRPADAAEIADKLATAGHGPRAELFHVYRARLHHAAADWADDATQAKRHRAKAAEALAAAVAADPRLKDLARVIQAEAEVAVLLDDEARAGVADPPAAACARAEVGFRLLGPNWFTARLAGHPFLDRNFAAAPFAAAANVPGGDITIARCAVLAAWGCSHLPPVPAGRPQPRLSFLAVPPDARLAPRARVAVLRHLRERVSQVAATPTLRALFAEPVVLQFALNLRTDGTLPTAAELTEDDARAWESEQKAWLDLFRQLKSRGLLPPALGDPER